MCEVVRSQGKGLGEDAGPLIELRVSLARHLWRIGPAWSVLAGAISTGSPLVGGSLPLRVLGAVVLADCAWGLVWRLMSGGGGIAAPERVAPKAPYAQPNAPLAEYLGRLHSMADGAAWHELAVALALAIGLSWLLGGVAVVLTLTALAVALLSRLVTGAGRRPALLYALLGVGLPWLLGTWLATGIGTDALLAREAQLHSLALGMAFVVLGWGLQRLYLHQGAGLRAIVLGQCVVLAVLVSFRAPWVLAAVTPLFLPPTWWVVSAAGDTNEIDIKTNRIAPWYWAAMMVSAILFG